MSQEMSQEMKHESLEDFSEIFLHAALEVLKQLKEEKPEYLLKKLGICSYVSHNIPSTLDEKWKDSYLLSFLASQWPSFSGDKNYPIPDPSLILSPAAIYKQSPNLWDKTTAYGRLRWEFVNFCIYYIDGYLWEKNFSQENSK